MKKRLIIFCTILFISSLTSGQTRISLFAGYGLSQFDAKSYNVAELEQSGYIPAGANIEFGRDMFTFGAEVSYSVMPFSFDLAEQGFSNAGELDQTQLYIGGFVKVRFGDRRDINPYIRGGVGYYTGKLKPDLSQEFKTLAQLIGYTYDESDIDFKGVIGFNGGIGLDFPVSSNTFIFIESIYHFVQQKADAPNAESFKANNFAFHLGLTYIL